MIKQLEVYLKMQSKQIQLKFNNKDSLIEEYVYAFGQ